MELQSYLLGKKAGGGTPISLQTKTVTVTSNGSSEISPDTGYDGLNKVVLTTNVPTGGGASDYFGDSANSSNVAVLIKKLPEATMTSTMISGISASQNLEEIENLNIPKVTTLNMAFNGCSNLKKVVLNTTDKLTTTSYMFQNCGNLESINLFNTENVTNAAEMFRGCNKLTTIPQFNLAKNTDFTRFCYVCSELVNFPPMDFSASLNFYAMFDSCQKLSDESLNNILGSLAGATTYTGTKKLTTLGIYTSVYPVSKIQGLSNYDDFIAAGWTIN